MKIIRKQQRKHQCRKVKYQLRKCLELRNGKQMDTIRKTIQENNGKQFEKILEQFAVYAWQNNRNQKTIMEIKTRERIMKIKSWKSLEKYIKDEF